MYFLIGRTVPKSSENNNDDNDTTKISVIINNNIKRKSLHHVNTIILIRKPNEVNKGVELSLSQNNTKISCHINLC